MTPVPVWIIMSIIVGTVVGAATAAVRVLRVSIFRVGHCHALDSPVVFISFDSRK